MRHSPLGFSVLASMVIATGSGPGCSSRGLDTGAVTGSAGNGGSGNAGGTTGAGGTGGSAGGEGGTGPSAAGSGGPGGSTPATTGAAGTVASGTAGSCGSERITASEATTIYRKFAFDVQPTLNPAVVFEARELDVARLWEDLHAQLFYVSGSSQDGVPFRDCTVLYYACQIVVPAGSCDQAIQPISSGLVSQGAFYFSWGAGSGVYRSRLGKLAPDGAQMTRTVSAEYRNTSFGPPPLVLITSGTDIFVYRVNSTAFNEWSTSDAQLIGKLQDLVDRLTIIDDSGRAIDTLLP